MAAASVVRALLPESPALLRDNPSLLLQLTQLWQYALAWDRNHPEAMPPTRTHDARMRISEQRRDDDDDVQRPGADILAGIARV